MPAADETGLIGVKTFSKETPFNGAVIVQIAKATSRSEMASRAQERQAGVVLPPVAAPEWLNVRLNCESRLAGSNIEWVFRPASPDDDSELKSFCGAEFGTLMFDVSLTHSDPHDEIRQALNRRIVELVAAPTKWKIHFFKRD